MSLIEAFPNSFPTLRIAQRLSNTVPLGHFPVAFLLYIAVPSGCPIAFRNTFQWLLAKTKKNFFEAAFLLD
jgi:cytochrome b subunit of formate dehydrogenase